MSKLIVTADIHGSYTSWLIMKNYLAPSDTLVIAGDLFDTRYGNTANPDFAPEQIKTELNTLDHPFFYVYGNCDTPSFFPGFDTQITFSAFDKTLFLSHGHLSVSGPAGVDIIIQGHTHCCSLEKKGTCIIMNPGSITTPRNGIHTYGVIEKNSARLMALKTGKTLMAMDF